MHYGDKQQIESAELEIVVYKHEILSNFVIVVYKHEILSNFKHKEMKRNKNGVISKRCVHYQVTSIRKCQQISPQLLNRILSDPYKHLSKDLDFLPFEEWILVKITDLDGWGKIDVKPISIVSKHPDETMRLH